MNKHLIKSILSVTLFLIAMTSHANDIELLVDKSMGQKALNAMDFPIEVRFPSNKATLRSEGYSVGDGDVGEVEFLSSGQDIKLVESDDISLVFEEAILEAINSYRSGTLDLNDLDSDEKKAIKLLSNASPVDTPLKKGILKAKENDIKQALQLLVTKKKIKFEILWVRFKVVDRPRLKLANPIELSNISTRTKAKAQACLSVFRKWVCAKSTTPWIRVDGKYAYLDLRAKNATVYALPRFKDLDIVITIKILKWRIKIPIGITSIVNREMRKTGPIELIDLSPLEQDIPYSNKKIKMDSISINNNPKGLLVKSNMKVE